jgi:hypothetical protein
MPPATEQYISATAFETHIQDLFSTATSTFKESEDFSAKQFVTLPNGIMMELLRNNAASNHRYKEEQKLLKSLGRSWKPYLKYSEYLSNLILEVGNKPEVSS